MGPRFYTSDRIGDALLFGWTQSAECAEVTVKVHFGLEVSLGDAARRSLDPLPRIGQFKVGSPGDHWDVVFQIVKRERAHAISPLLACGQRVDR